MLTCFNKAFVELKDFIADRSEIEIGDSVISIPESVRSQFYMRFNATRTAFVEERFPDLLRSAKILKEHYDHAESEIARLITFEDPQTAVGVQNFLQNPTDSLARELFDPLFDLLKGRCDVDAFDAKVSGRVEALFPGLFRGGYEKWVEIALVNLLHCDKAFRVDVRQLYPGERAKSAAQAPMHEVPCPSESRIFLFNQPRNDIFAVPDFIVRSSRLDRYLGIRTDFRAAFYNALDPSHDREWYPVSPDMLRFLNSGLTLIYEAEQPETIALVADVGTICRPDVILWCLDPGSMTLTEVYEKAAIFGDCFRPLKGFYIVALKSWPEQTSESPVLEPDHLEIQPQNEKQLGRVQLLTAGYDPSGLTPVMDALNETDGMTATT